MAFDTGNKFLKCYAEVGRWHLPVSAPYLRPCKGFFKILGCYCHLHLSAMHSVTLFYDKNSQVAGLGPDWHRLTCCVQLQPVASVDVHKLRSLEHNILVSLLLTRSWVPDTQEAAQHTRVSFHSKAESCRRSVDYRVAPRTVYPSFLILPATQALISSIGLCCVFLYSRCLQRTHKKGT